ncbi:hypothetical protein R3P38DRAFT_3048273 [Favolaschia claudopus]|uniref:Uncharacterized protein n=1 Tax=Favolaschia claudopus TaxID=2862362 RepID=A0AAW0A558_9AGAR
MASLNTTLSYNPPTFPTKYLVLSNLPLPRTHDPSGPVLPLPSRLSWLFILTCDSISILIRLPLFVFPRSSTSLCTS